MNWLIFAFVMESNWSENSPFCTCKICYFFYKNGWLLKYKLVGVRRESIKIEQITIPMRNEELLRWKEHDISIVPEFALKWKGNGVSNGYGFGEWMAERYFRSLGYYVINDEFDLFSKVSKYKRYNGIITSIIGSEKMDIF